MDEKYDKNTLKIHRKYVENTIKIRMKNNSQNAFMAESQNEKYGQHSSSSGTALIFVGGY